jgi:hypothetical protein
VFLCGVLAGIVWIILGAMVTALLGRDFAALPTWCSFGFFPPSTVIPVMIGTLPALILATIVGAKFYKD